MSNFEDVTRLARNRQQFYPDQAYNRPAMVQVVNWVLPRHRVILDIGCGDGGILTLLKGMYPAAELVGLSAREDEAAAAEANSGQPVRVGDMHRLPFPDESFDLVIARHVFEHSPAPLMALCEANRVLKPGGDLIMVVPNEKQEWLVRYEDHFSVLPHAGWSKLLGDAGFAVTQTEDGKWLASASMAEEVEYRFVARKERSALSAAGGAARSGESALRTAFSAPVPPRSEHPVAVVLHNMTLFETIEPMLRAAPVPVDIYVPTAADPQWRAMAEATHAHMTAMGYRSRLMKEPPLDQYRVCLSATPYDRLPKADFQVRFMYGLAKETWNFDVWNLNYDLILTYGDHDTESLQAYTAAVPVGNVKLAPLRKSPRQQGGLPRLLYAPTYGEACSLERVAPVLKQLGTHFDVTVKLHHGSYFLEPDRVRLAQEIGRVVAPTASLCELLGETDIVLSDGSGAIFDAIGADVPVVVYQPFAPERFEGRLSLEEQVLRDGLVRSVREPQELSGALTAALNDETAREAGRRLAKQLFRHAGDEAVAAAWKAIGRILTDDLVDRGRLATRRLRRHMAGLTARIQALEEAHRQAERAWQEQRSQLLTDIQSLRSERDLLIQTRGPLTAPGGDGLARAAGLIAGQANASIREALERQDYETAVDQLGNMLDVLPVGEWQYLLACSLHWSKRDLSRALTSYNAALTLGFSEFWVRYNRGTLLLEMNDREAARADLERARELDPEHDGVKVILASIAE